MVLAAAACLSMTNVLLIATRWPPARKAQEGEEVSWREANPYFLLKTTLTTPTLKIYGAMNFLDAFALSMFLTAMPLFTKSRYGWGPPQLGLFFLCFGTLVPLQLGLL